MIGVTILGSTGTIGVNTLDVIARNRDRFRVVALAANRSVDRLLAQCREWRPEFAVLDDPSCARALERELAGSELPTRVLAGPEGLAEVARLDSVGYVMAGIVGAAGLLPTLAAARAGKRVLLANKEALVMSGRLFMDAVREHGAELVPIDSEHNAVFQCLPPGPHGRAGGAPPGVKRILLTGSGGPFRTMPAGALAEVTPEHACAHPNWVMGPKISVDSATMMNKGLEVIEACWLFGTGPEQIEVVIHPQSVIHSMVEYDDGSVLAQLGHPDMRTPIAHALGWPERVVSGVGELDLPRLGRLDFESPDLDKLPCLRLGYEAARLRGTTPTVLNAANEVAVEAFLGRRIKFTDIPRVIEATLADSRHREAHDIEAILDEDRAARRVAAGYVEAIGKG